MTQLLHLGCGGRIASCDIDAVFANTARAMHAWSCVEPRVAVHVGHAVDWLASCTLDSIDALFLDHRGTRYHDDLLVAEACFSCGARVIADNVLLWRRSALLWRRMLGLGDCESSGAGDLGHLKTGNS